MGHFGAQAGAGMLGTDAKTYLLDLTEVHEGETLQGVC